MLNVKLDNITINQGKKNIYKNFSYEFYNGCYAIIGKNGTGKSTLLSAIAGSLMPSYGRIMINDISLFENPSLYKNQLFFVPDNANFYPFIKGKEFLDFILNIFNKPYLRNSRKLSNYKDIFNLKKHMETKFYDMSLGTRIKFFLYAAFLVDAPVLIMDEPFNGLDKESVETLLAIIKENEKEKIIILTTHHENIISNVKVNRLLLEGIPNSFLRETNYVKDN